MIHTLLGKLIESRTNYAVIETAGIGFKVMMSANDVAKLPIIGEETRVFCFLHARENSIELFGFLEEQSLKLFEMLNTVSGVGPKTALAVTGLDSAPNVMAAIVEKKADLLSRAPGIGKKTAERIILELNNKIKLTGSEGMAKNMGVASEVEELLIGLGYSRSQVKQAIEEVKSASVKTVEEYLRAALRVIGKTK